MLNLRAVVRKKEEGGLYIILAYLLVLTHEVPVLPSYRNKSIDLHSKSTDCFLYQGDTGTYWVKEKVGKYAYSNNQAAINRFKSEYSQYTVLRAYTNNWKGKFNNQKEEAGQR